MSGAPLALFPLHTVLFPGADLALRIFEARYLDLVSACLRADVPFGVCLIRAGSEVGAPAACHPIGTSARIVDWSRRADGLLGIQVRGEDRFRVDSQTVQPDQLIQAEVSWLPGDPAPVSAAHQQLQALLRDLLAPPDAPYRDALQRASEADWLGFRLAELLPLDVAVKQRLLEMPSGAGRLDALTSMLSAGADADR